MLQRLNLAQLIILKQETDVLWVVAIFFAWLGVVVGAWFFGQHAEEKKSARRQSFGTWVVDK